MSYDKPFTKENLEYYLKELAKEYRKRSRKSITAEIVLVGGASILINYGFRDMTYDMDAVIHASSVIKEAINVIGDRFNLPNGWLNTDVIKTDSYTPKLVQYSIPYKKYSNILEIRTVSAEYLVAMKLVSGRQYKNDLSDIIGILYSHYVNGKPITKSRIDKAITEMYGSWESVSTDIQSFIESVMNTPDLGELYSKYIKEENENHNILIEAFKNDSKAMNRDNMDEILKAAKEKKQKK